MRLPLLQICICQAALLVVLAVMFSLGAIQGLGSAMVGGLLFMVPNAYFTYYAFRYSGARFTPWIAQSFYRGQSGKWLLTIVGFALVFRFMKPLNVPVLFGVYGAMIILQVWLASRVANQLKH